MLKARSQRRYFGIFQTGVLMEDGLVRLRIDVKTEILVKPENATREYAALYRKKGASEGADQKRYEVRTGRYSVICVPLISALGLMRIWGVWRIYRSV